MELSEKLEYLRVARLLTKIFKYLFFWVSYAIQVFTFNTQSIERMP